MHPHLASHEFDKLGTDGQSQTGTAKPAGSRAIGLSKSFEDQCLLLRRNSDTGVFHCEVKADRVLILRLQLN